VGDAEVALTRRRARFLLALPFAAAVIVLATVAMGSAGSDGVASQDPLEPLLDYRPPAASVVTDRHGREIGRFFVQRRQLVGLEEVPDHLIDAFVASEDAQFFAHGGLDFPAILRAAWVNVSGGRIRHGASTITQQVVKNVLLTPERTWARKVQEMLLALEVERRLSKHEILLVYLNQIYLGNGSYGVGDAARSYFGKSVSELDLSEAALLAGLPQRPSAYSPTRHPEAAEARRRYVLAQMLERGLVSADQHAHALANPPRVVQGAGVRAGAPDPAGHFIEEVRRELVWWLGARALHANGLTIETSLDLDLQRQAQAAVRAGLEALDRRQGWRGPVRRAPAELLDDALVEIGWQNRWNTGPVEATATADPRPRLGLVLEAASDEEGRQRLRVGLAPGVVLPGTVDPRDWGMGAGGSGGLLGVGDVARFRVETDEDGTPRVGLYQEPRVEGSLLSLDVASGDVLAMVGGYAFERSEFNRVVQARRQPGSAFKPFVYAAALESGYTQASFVLDAPSLFWDPARDAAWRPRNYGGRFLGWITLRRALARSVNNASIQLAQRVGVDRVVDVAQRLGVESALRPNLSLALGSSELTLLELTRAYAAFPARGERVRARFVRRVRDAGGRVLLEDLALGERGAQAEPAPPDAPRALSRSHARIVTDLLQGAVSEPGATGARARRLGARVAGKTGTTNGNRDAWFVGFSPEVATGVWVGFDRPRPLGPRETGGRAALPIWVDYMGEALARIPPRDFDFPAEVSFARVDPVTGRVSTRGARSTWQAFVTGTEPRRAPRPERRERASLRELWIEDL